MAKIVAGFASSHSPLMSLPGQDWAKRAEDDKKNRELVRPTDGKHVTYEQLLESADPKIAETHIHEEVFCQKFNAIQM
ncbi:MAG TPA: extradiol ring-cleavage dioxygenase, partial [Chloroflexota bacterium]